MGLPLAYLISLLLIHLPGAYSYAASNGLYRGVAPRGLYSAIGIVLTAVSAVTFVAGVYLCRSFVLKRPLLACVQDARLKSFPIFCLVGGWFMAFGLVPLSRSLASVGAALSFGSSIWILGVMLGLDRSLHHKRIGRIVGWTSALLLYPAVILIFNGFLSYGVAAIITVAAFVMMRLKNVWLICFGAPFAMFVGLSIFVNYFANRDDLRDVLWTTVGTEDRVTAVIEAFSNFSSFDYENTDHLRALSSRLNQNEFVGLAATRLERGDVDFLEGRSFYEGFIAIVPRIVWPDKPVFGGSPDVVRHMTGLNLSKTTSWGVGNVMEFYINFGLWSLIPGFLALGALIAFLDLRCFQYLDRGQAGKSLLYLLPGLALIQPNGSLVELAGGGMAALIAAIFWRAVWVRYQARSPNRVASGR